MTEKNLGILPVPKKHKIASEVERSNMIIEGIEDPDIPWLNFAIFLSKFRRVERYFANYFHEIFVKLTQNAPCLVFLLIEML